MATPMTTNEQREADFQAKNQWHSFKGAVYGGIGQASFFGVLMALGSAVVAAAAGIPSGTALLGGLVAGPLPLIAVGAMMAAGAVFTYMGQREATIIKSLQDTHLAEETAMCTAPGHGKEKCAQVEYEQNQRSDGKTWNQALAANQNQPAINR